VEWEEEKHYSGLPQFHTLRVLPQMDGTPWGEFTKGTRCVFQRWTVIQLAVQQGWGGGESDQKAGELVEDTLFLFQHSE